MNLFLELDQSAPCSVPFTAAFDSPSFCGCCSSGLVLSMAHATIVATTSTAYLPQSRIAEDLLNQHCPVACYQFVFCLAAKIGVGHSSRVQTQGPVLTIRFTELGLAPDAVDIIVHELLHGDGLVFLPLRP
jgi:hypothetical protein